MLTKYIFLVNYSDLFVTLVGNIYIMHISTRMEDTLEILNKRVLLYTQLLDEKIR